MAALLGFLLELIIVGAIVVFVGTQIVWPAIQGEPIFPYKRKKRQALREEFEEAGAKMRDASIEAQTKKRQASVLPDKIEPEPVAPVKASSGPKVVDIKPKTQVRRRKAKTRKAAINSTKPRSKK